MTSNGRHVEQQTPRPPRLPKDLVAYGQRADDLGLAH